MFAIDTSRRVGIITESSCPWLKRVFKPFLLGVDRRPYISLSDMRFESINHSLAVCDYGARSSRAAY